MGLCLVATKAWGETVGSHPGVKKLVEEAHARFAEWDRAAQLTLYLVIVIGSLGVLTSVIQALKHKWVKAILILCGAAVGILTVVQTAAFQGDHRAYKRLVNRARQPLRDIDFFASAEVATPAEREQMVDHIKKALIELDQLENKFLADPPPTGDANQAGLLSLLVSEAHAAAPPRPAWLTTPPSSDERHFYFVGVSTSDSLETAKADAWGNAIERASQALALQLPSSRFDTPALARYLAESAEKVESFVESDKGTGLYTYSVLGVLNKRSFERDAILFAVRENVTLPQEVTQAATSLRPQEAATYFQRREDRYVDLLSSSRAAVSADVYRLFEEGRQERRAGKAEPAVRILEEVVAKAPDFFMAWYNLGLAYEALKKPKEAAEAYQKAIALEPQQKPRDASVYNTYGWLLYRQDQYMEAEKLFRQALSLDPEHPLAKKNLKATSQLMNAAPH
ncbi:MAG: tetratricopeptide repeat protein [Myxococcaceae bacterium]|nr:tetratricopeptide repeat protein [Myxococcaceae bacterium]